MSYIVTAPLVVVPDDEGKVHYHYRGALLGHLDDETAEHLLDLGMIERAERAERATVPEPTPTGGQDQGDGGTVPRPAAQTAPKAEWVAYAVSKGMTEAEAASLSRAEIAAKFPED